MKSKKILSLVFTICIGICFASLLPVFGSAAIKTISDIADKDTYVNSYAPDNNFGTQNYAFAGKFVGTDDTEAYFSFPFTNQPDEYTKAEIAIYVSDADLATSISFSLIDDTWGESGVIGINWTTRLSHGQWLEDVAVPATESANAYYIYIDITDIIQDTDTRISICINGTTGLDTKNVILNTRESGDNKPKLVWTYEGPDDIPGYDVVIIGVISIAMLGLLYKKIKIQRFE